ncbi:MAG: aminopeptidase P family protein [Alphaproteobacteria bacterium]|nr:MAG: aminopeptidase P family protein [Alphaproteobacteria bacterium]
MPELSRRGFGLSAFAAGAAFYAPKLSAAAAPELKDMTGDIAPITTAERLARVDKAQRLMRAHKLGAILIEPGASLDYFTGVQWHRSERVTAAIIPAEGRPLVVTPFFEEPSVRESLAIPADVETWQEDEDPLKLVATRLAKWKTRTLGIEETARYLAFSRLPAMVPGLALDNAAPVVRGCRMVKSLHEIALMQKASDVTIAAYRYTWPRIEKGMTPAEIGAIMNGATEKLGGSPEFALVLLGEAAAYPHGSGKPQQVKDGEVVLMDCGCTVHGYQSDISRTFVFGGANAEQRKVWNQVRKGQDIAFAAARIGTPAGAVDDAVRRQYEAWGYGPRYKLPGTSHRTGHGIGMEGHEPVNLVHGETTKLAPGMCFSNEPGIYIPGQFGIRLEDCFHMTETGPRWFSEPPPSIDRPFG